MTQRAPQYGPTTARPASAAGTGPSAPAGARSTRSRASGLLLGAWRSEEARRALLATLPAWVVARVAVIGALVLAHFLVNRLHPAAPVVFRVHQGLLGWDAGFYQSIAAHGYGAVSSQALRFFPLFPLLGAALAAVIRISPGDALLVLSNLLSLVAGALLYHLAYRETGDLALARRATWLLALAPPAFVLVMGYSEPLMLVLGIGAFLALRAQRWWWAAAAGVLLGLTRPLGLLFVLPAAIEAYRGLRGAGRAQWLARAVAVVSPAVGTGAFMAWVGARYGDAFLPIKVQTESGHHGGLADPVTTLFHNAWQLLHGNHVGSGLHVPWVILMVALIVVAFMRWPSSYGALAVLTLGASVSSTNLDSVERYALGAFPFVLSGATLTASARVERVVLCVLAAGLVAYSLLAFMNQFVP